MKISLQTLGCKLNQAESEDLRRRLVVAGHEIARPGEAAVYIINTCTVTRAADADARQLLRTARRVSPDAFIVVTGCYAERAPGELTGLGADLVLNNAAKDKLPALLEEHGLFAATRSAPATGSRQPARTRALIKVQEGCTRFCSYCIVPYVRGSERSQSAGDVVAAINQRAGDGYREVVVTGTNIGSYEDRGLKLADLLRAILAETPIERVRLSSLQPQELSTELLELWRDNRLCPHFHLSLQSGCDSVLARMNRQYTADQYAAAVAAIRRFAPMAAITTDVIVGFPGETDAEFQASYDFCLAMDFARIHVFSFSPRRGTAAAGLGAAVPEPVKKARSRQLLALAAESAARFRRRFRGSVMPVLWEKRSAGVWTGLTGNYIRVSCRSSADLSNRLLPGVVD